MTEIMSLAIDTYAGSMERVREIKANPKTYRTYQYNVRTKREVSLEVFGNRIYFLSVPSKITIRFNEPENDRFDFGKPLGIKQDFYRVYLEWDATETDNPLIFIAGFNIDFQEMSDVFKRPVDLVYLSTPLDNAVDAATLGIFDTTLYSELLLDCYSDIDGILHLYTGFDGVSFYNGKTIPITGGAGDYKSLPIESKWLKIVFEKAVPGTPQAILNISARARL